MWTLTNESTGEILYLSQKKEKVKIGKQGDFILKNDTSISRNHGALFQEDGKLFVADYSKYGIFVNDDISKRKKTLPDNNSKLELKVGDTILFGICQNQWVVGKSSPKTVTTSFTMTEKNNLGKFLESADVEIQDAFDSSTTHLTTKNLTITVKVLQALMENIPIVSVEFWKKFAENIKTCKVIPKCEDYRPKNEKDVIKNFNFDINRNRLFAGRIFIFMNKFQRENYTKVIELGGGKVKELTKKMAKSVLIRDSVILVSYFPRSESETCSQTVNEITEFVKKNKKRPIPEHEIGLAILECSTEKYCNPKYTPVSEIISNTDPKFNLGTEIIQETPSMNSEKNKPSTSCELFDSDDDKEILSAMPVPKSKAIDIKDCSLEGDEEIFANLEIPKALEGKRKASPLISSNKKARRSDETIKKVDTTNQSKLIEQQPTTSKARKSIIAETVPNSENSSNTYEESGKSPTTSTQKMEAQRLIIEESEIFDSQKGISEKPTENISSQKRRIDEDSDEENFFALPAKKSYKKLAEPLKDREQLSKDKDPPVQEVSLSSQSEGFISRASKSVKAAEEVKEPTPKPTVIRKKLVVLENNDSDGEDDFFNFGKKLKLSDESKKDEEDEHFNFNNSRTQSKKSKEWSKTSIYKPKIKTIQKEEIKEEDDDFPIEPVKITKDGWLCSSIRTVKKENSFEIKNEDPNIYPVDENWIKAIKGSFVVETLDSSTFLKSRSSSNTSNTTSNSSLNSTSGGKNFKKFVKYNNYKPQTHVINTIPFHVDCSVKFF